MITQMLEQFSNKMKEVRMMIGILPGSKVSHPYLILNFLDQVDQEALAARRDPKGWTSSMRKEIRAYRGV